MGTIIRIIIAVAVGVMIMRVGMKMLGSFSAPMGEPPPPGELRKVKIVYQCQMCGSEVRMTSAPFSDPEPPRHCMDEMVMISKSDVGQ